MLSNKKTISIEINVRSIHHLTRPFSSDVINSKVFTFTIT